MRLIAATPLLLCALGCGSSTTGIAIDITLGHEADALSASPAVTRVDVELVSSDGAIDVKASAKPGESFDLGNLSGSALFTCEVTGVTADGKTVARGRSLGGVALDAVNGGGFDVFVERLGGFSRPPGGLPTSRRDAVAGVSAERYLLMTGGTGTTTPATGVFYDLFSLDGGATSQAFPRTAKTMVTQGTQVFLIDDHGASVIDASTGDTTEVSAPTGATFADVAGGQVVGGGDGRTFVVGGTRAAPSKVVLVIAADGTLSAVPLTVARAGASATWVDKIGLVVAGGSPTGAGVEALAPGASAFAAKPFPADSTIGAGAAVGGTGALVLAGGATPDGKPVATRTLDLACGSACQPTAVKGAELGVVTTRTQAYTLSGNRVIVVADDATGATRSFLLDLGASAMKELPLREPRKGATPIAAPNGTLVVLGGEHLDGSPALTVESFFPE